MEQLAIHILITGLDDEQTKPIAGTYACSWNPTMRGAVLISSTASHFALLAEAKSALLMISTLHDLDVKAFDIENRRGHSL